MAYVLAVDLGTTFTAAAAAEDGGAEILELGAESAALPSVVVLRADGTIVAGDAAERRSVTEPSRTAREFKRRLGDATPIIVGQTPYGAETLTAHLLAQVIGEAVERQGGPPAATVLTHPANYGPYKLGLLEEAARIAGAQNVSYLPEPVAAAVHYSGLERVETGETVAVYDFGGGTFDAAVVRRVEDGFEIVGEPGGIERLGGIDLDEAILAYVRSVVGDAVVGLDPDDATAMAALARLRVECRRAKEGLSSDTDVTIPVMLPSVHTEVRLTRSVFEDMIRPRIRDTIAVLGRVVRSAGLEFADLTRVLLVGGSSRIPLVAEMVAAETGCVVAVDTHPKHAVSLGAARHGVAGAAYVPPVAKAAPTEPEPVGAPAAVALGKEGPAAVRRGAGRVRAAVSRFRIGGVWVFGGLAAGAAVAVVLTLVFTAGDDDQAAATAVTVGTTAGSTATTSRAADDAAMVAVPSVMGMSLSEARTAVGVSGLSISSAGVVEVPCGDAGHDVIVDQSPAEGVEVTAGSVVSVAIGAESCGEETSETTGATVTDPTTALGEFAQLQVDVGSVPGATIVDGGGAVWFESGPSSILRVDVSGGEVDVQRFDLAAWSLWAAVGEGAAWVTHPDAARVSRIDAATGDVTEIAVAESPGAVAVGFGSVWVAHSGPGMVSRIDPVTGAVVATISVGAGPSAILVGDEAVWVANQFQDSTVTRIDPFTNESLDLWVGYEPYVLAHGEGGLWVSLVGVPEDTTITRLDLASYETTEVYVGVNPGGIEVVGGAVWVTGIGDPDRGVASTLVRVDPSTLEATPVDFGGAELHSLAPGDGVLWAMATPEAGARADRLLFEVLPSGEAIAHGEAPAASTSMSVDGNRLWFSTYEGYVVLLERG